MHEHTHTQIICFSQNLTKMTNANLMKYNTPQTSQAILIGCWQAQATGKLRLLDSADEKLHKHK